MTSRNEARTQVDPALLEQFMKQQEAKFVAPTQTQAPPPTRSAAVYSVPTDFVELPSRGKYYLEGHPWHKKEKVEIKYMTTKEEDIITSPAYAREGKTFDKLLESVIVDRVNVGSLLTGDRNAILINTRKNAYGPHYEFYGFCEKCYETKELTIDLNSASIKEFDNLSCEKNSDGTFTVQLPQSKEAVQFRLFCGEDDAVLQKQEAAREKHNLPYEKIVLIHRQVIVSVSGNSDPACINQFAQNMLIRDSKFLQKAYIETKPDVSLRYDFICETCDHQNQGDVPFGANFFWPNE